MAARLDGDELIGYVIPATATTAPRYRRSGGAGAVASAIGIGRALLLAAFTTLRDRGQSVVRLYVDAQNVTGAVRVYEAAGMHVSRRFDVLEKPLS